MSRQTVAEKIISRHAAQPVSADELVIVDVDGIMASDTTAPMAIRTFQKMGGNRPFDPEKVFFVIDHAAPAPNERIADLHLMMRAFAAENNIKLYDIGEGICHQLMIENGHVKPGDLFLGADSHTCTYGSLGAFAAGIGSTDLAAVMLTGKTWLKVPRTIKVEIAGKLSSGVGAKDLVLAVIARLGIAGATYQAIEFHGRALSDLSLDSRMTIANMAVEMGAKVGLIHPAGLEQCDAVVSKLCIPDEDADYSSIVSIDVGSLRPQVSRPHEPDHVSNASDLSGTHIHCGFIGSCANGRLEDLKAAAAILKGQKIAPGVRLIISPASRKVFLEAVQQGIVEILTMAGATFISAGCGPCVGTHNGVPGKGEVVISTANRNFQGRMGNPNADIYLASPMVVAASAIAGEIIEPQDIKTL